MDLVQVQVPVKADAASESRLCPLPTPPTAMQHGPAPLLSGGDFALAPLARADEPALVAACREAEAVASLNVPQPYTRADAEAHVRAARAGDGGFFWAIRDASGALVGMVKLGFSSLPPPSSSPPPAATDSDATDGTASAEADVGGIYLLPSHRGTGLATRAARLVAQWAFGAGFDTLNWECLASNAASIAVAERLGFIFYADGVSSSQYEHHKHKAVRLARLRRGELR